MTDSSLAHVVQCLIADDNADVVVAVRSLREHQGMTIIGVAPTAADPPRDSTGPAQQRHPVILISIHVERELAA
jgi:hypothetical protein